MKFSCTQENLHQGLQVVAHGATKNINLPILNNVLIRIEDSGIKLTTTNLEIAVTATVRGKIDEPGEFTVPSRLFADYVALLPNSRIDVALVGDSFNIETTSAKTKVKGLPASEFPLIPRVDRTRAYRVPLSDFRHALAKVIFAVSANESRPELSGVLLKFLPAGPTGELLLAATDSYRLAEARVVLHEGDGLPARSVIVPNRTMAELLRIIGVFKESPEAKATLQIVCGENQILFIYDSVELVSRTIEGKYPEYGAVIPENIKTTVTVRRDELVKAVKTSALFSRSGVFDVNLGVDAAGKRLTVRSTDSQTGENESALLSEVSGLDNAVTLNHRYLLEGLGALEGEEATLRLVDGTTPCILVPAGEKPGYLYIVMPIKQ